MRLIVFGHQRHGKDTACEYLWAHFDLSFVSSSFFACDRFIFDQMKDEHGYRTVDECFNDRINHRDTWYNAIRSYNDGDRTRLGREIFDSHDVYCGIRDRDEFYALKAAGLVDLAIWIDASDRLPPEGSGSMNLTREDADIIVSNNTDLADFHVRLERLAKLLTR